MEKYFFHRRHWQFLSVLFVGVIFAGAICGSIFLLSFTKIIYGVIVSAIVSLAVWFILNRDEAEAKAQGKAPEFRKIPLFIFICAACLFISLAFQTPLFAKNLTIENLITGLVAVGVTLLILRLIYWKEIKTKKDSHENDP